jgi:hypothetical protein
MGIQRKWFAIGRRCTTDELLKLMGIRTCSSPLSYCMCDLETAVHLVNSNFEGFLNGIESLKNYKGHYLPFWRASKVMYVNQSFTDEDFKSKNIYECKRFLIWIHHNLEDPTMLQTLRRRQVRLSESLNNPTLSVNLLYISEQMNTACLTEYCAWIQSLDISCFCGDKNKLVIVVPCEDLKMPVDFYKSTNNFDVWLFKSIPMAQLCLQKNIGDRSKTFLDADIFDKRIPWTTLASRLKLHYGL